METKNEENLGHLHSNNESSQKVTSQGQQEEREKSRKGRYYGRMLITILTIFISCQYYIYVYEITWKTTTSINNNYIIKY